MDYLTMFATAAALLVAVILVAWIANKIGPKRTDAKVNALVVGVIVAYAALFFLLTGCATTPNKIASDVILSLDYVSDGDKDHWQRPEETVERGAGDCEDFALLIHKRLSEAGYKPEIHTGRVPQGFHMWVRLGNKIYDNYGIQTASDKYQKKYEYTTKEVEMVIQRQRS